MLSDVPIILGLYLMGLVWPKPHIGLANFTGSTCGQMSQVQILPIQFGQVYIYCLLSIIFSPVRFAT